MLSSSCQASNIVWYTYPLVLSHHLWPPFRKSVLTKVTREHELLRPMTSTDTAGTTGRGQCLVDAREVMKSHFLRPNVAIPVVKGFVLPISPWTQQHSYQPTEESQLHSDSSIKGAFLFPCYLVFKKQTITC